jgi:hypothetical protein
LYEATENELEGSDFKNKTTRVLKVTDFEKAVCPPVSTLKFVVLVLKLKYLQNILRNEV